MGQFRVIDGEFINIKEFINISRALSHVNKFRNVTFNIYRVSAKKKRVTFKISRVSGQFFPKSARNAGNVKGDAFFWLKRGKC